MNFTTLKMYEIEREKEIQKKIDNGSCQKDFDVMNRIEKLVNNLHLSFTVIYFSINNTLSRLGFNLNS